MGPRPGDLPDELVYVRISVFGQTGPYSPRPGLDRLGIAFGGLLHLTGDPDRPAGAPRGHRVGLPDRGLRRLRRRAGLYGRDAGAGGARGGRGDRRPALRVGAAHPGVDAGRLRPPGHRPPARGQPAVHSAPLDNYPTADGFYVCIVAGSDANFTRLCAAMGRPELAERPPLRHPGRAGGPGRRDQRHRGRLDGVASPAERSRRAASTTTCRSGTAYSAADIFADPHMAARGDLVAVDDPVIGPVRQQAPFPRLAGSPAPSPRGAPRSGEHNREVWCDLVGLSDAELADLADRGVV